jgi:hypothetical protein
VWPVVEPEGCLESELDQYPAFSERVATSSSSIQSLFSINVGVNYINYIQIMIHIST